MAPTDVAGLVINGLDHALAPNVVIRARPPVDSIGWLRKVDTPTGMRVHDKQPGFRVETRRTVVGHTALVGRNQASVGRGLFGGIWNGTALLVDPKRPVHWPKRVRQQILPVGAVKNKEVAVA